MHGVEGRFCDDSGFGEGADATSNVTVVLPGSGYISTAGRGRTHPGIPVTIRSTGVR